MLTPYKEQQEPWGQFPHTVLPFEAPHVPSVVIGPEGAGDAVGLPKTGSWLVLAMPPFVVAVGVPVPPHPLWHPVPQLTRPSVKDLSISPPSRRTYWSVVEPQ